MQKVTCWKHMDGKQLLCNHFFRVRVIRMLVEEELLAPEMARRLLGWKHSGFSVHNGKPLRRDDAAGLERVSQYIISLRPSGYDLTRPQPLLRAEEGLQGRARRTPTSRRNRSVQNCCRMGVNCRQPADVARPGPHHTPAGRILDPRAGFLVWFSQKSGTSRGVAALLSGS